MPLTAALARPDCTWAARAIDVSDASARWVPARALAAICPAVCWVTRAACRIAAWYGITVPVRTTRTV
ncbi:hypothetical protein, partial [Streptomyces rimosus]|uniref:hypothetical protein n=1 Tax=Streptomyces rimosus TaxID=1927 RepID=UPI001A92F669